MKKRLFLNVWQWPVYHGIKKFVHICIVIKVKCAGNQFTAFLKAKLWTTKCFCPFVIKSAQVELKVRNFSSYFEKLWPSEWVLVLNREHPKKRYNAQILSKDNRRRGPSGPFKWERAEGHFFVPVCYLCVVFLPHSSHSNIIFLSMWSMW